MQCGVSRSESAQKKRSECSGRFGFAKAHSSNRRFFFADAEFVEKYVN